MLKCSVVQVEVMNLTVPFYGVSSYLFNEDITDPLIADTEQVSRL